MMQIAQRLRRQGKSVFDLQAAKNEMSPEKDKYVFITILKGHASIVVVDKELFDTFHCYDTYFHLFGADDTWA